MSLRADSIISNLHGRKAATRPVRSTTPNADARVRPARDGRLPARRLGRGRRIAVRLLAVLALLSFNFLLIFVFSDAVGRLGEVQELERPGSVQARIGAEHPGEAVHIVGAAAAVVFGVTGLAGLAVRPERAGSATHAGLAAVGWLLASAVVGDPDNHGGHVAPIDLAFVGLAVPALLAAFLAAPWRSWRAGRAPRHKFLLVALVGAPWLWHGVQQGLMQRHTWPPLADPHHQAHWFATSLIAFLIVLVVAGGSLAGDGWRLATITAGTSAVAIAVASVASPDSASALHPAWAAGALLWGFAVLGLTMRFARVHPA